MCIPSRENECCGNGSALTCRRNIRATTILITQPKTEEKNSKSIWHKDKVLDSKLLNRACVFFKPSYTKSCRKCVCRSSFRRKENQGYKHIVKLKNDHGNHQPPSFLLSEKAKPPEILINFVKILLAGNKKVSE